MRLPKIPLHTLGFILLLEVLALLFLLYRPSPRPQLASSTTISAMSVPDGVMPDIPPVAPLVIPWPTIGPLGAERTLTIANTDVYSTSEQLALSEAMEQALIYVSERFGHPLQQPVVIHIERDPDCILNGAAEPLNHRAYVYTCSTIPYHRAVNILAHEFVHQLAYDYYGAAHENSDLILMEGLATWAAGDYWLGGQPTFASFVSKNYKEENLPLATHYAGRSIHEMNALYYRWASFVEFLINTYGRDHFDALYVSGHKTPGSANYTGVYGKDLDTLEQEWQIWLES